jgi:hypothetical protein
MNQDYMTAFRGRFTSAMRWPQLDDLWQALKTRNDGAWYIYAIGEEPPVEPAASDRLETFIQEVDALLRREHDHDYCGIVYADNLAEPSIIKIYDPNNLGVSCGFSDNPPLPGWVLSRIQPVDLPMAMQPPNNRRRWWQKIFT